MVGKIPMLKDGKMVYFWFFSEEGEREVEEVDLPLGAVKEVPILPLHPRGEPDVWEKIKRLNT